MDKNTNESAIPVECPDKGIVEEPIEDIDSGVDEREAQIMKILAEMAGDEALDAEIYKSFQEAEEQNRVREAEHTDYEEADERIREFEAIEEARAEEDKKGDELINNILGL